MPGISAVDTAFVASVAAAPASPAANAEVSAKPGALFSDPDRLLPLESPAAKELEARLIAFAETSGIKIHVRLIAKFAPQTPSQRPGNVAAGISRQLKLTANEILAVYFADIEKWGLWIGEHHVNHFVGRPGTVRELTKDGSFHHAKLVFIAAAQAQGVAQATAAAQSGPVSDVQKIQFQGSAMADAFIAKFSPAPPPPAAPAP